MVQTRFLQAHITIVKDKEIVPTLTSREAQIINNKVSKENDKFVKSLGKSAEHMKAELEDLYNVNTVTPICKHYNMIVGVAKDRIE